MPPPPSGCRAPHGARLRRAVRRRAGSRLRSSLGGALAGYGDQRNYELFIEAGFAPAVAIRIMTLNGARILGVDRELGSVERGKRADLVVLEGDLTATPAAIEKPSTVFKDGVAYDSAKLIASVEGRVGID